MGVTIIVISMTQEVRKLLICLECGHPFFERVADIYRRCGACGSTSIVEREELKMASAAIKPWAHLLKGALPPLPSPTEAIGFPASLGWFFSIMGKAKSNTARKRGAQLMLEDAGLNRDEAKEVAAKMYPD